MAPARIPSVARRCRGMEKMWIVRHGETEWSSARKHTSTTDVELTRTGELQAAALGRRLAGEHFSLVLVSPLVRARRTAELAGLGAQMELDDDLVEFRYGAYEGLTTTEISMQRPGWNLWRDGCPNGETAQEVGRRLDRVIHACRAASGSVLIVAHGHSLRILAARWLEQDAAAGGLYALDPATVSILGTEHNRPVMRTWNDSCHLG